MLKTLPAYEVKVLPETNMGGCFRRVSEVTVNDLDADDPVLTVHRGDLGVGHSNLVTDISARPIIQPFLVAWDGDTQKPSFRFDGYPDVPFKFRVEAWY